MKKEEFYRPELHTRRPQNVDSVMSLEDWESLDHGYLFELMDQWLLSQNLKTIRDGFKDEISPDFVRHARMEYLEGELVRLNEEIQRMEELSRVIKFSFCESVPEAKEWGLSFTHQDLLEFKRRYKKLYIEYGELKGGFKLEKNATDPLVVEQCRQVPMEDIVGVPVINAGCGRRKCLCPFHLEKTPSFVIYPDNSWFCFGCNQHGGNAIDFIMQKDNKKFLEAVDYLKGFC